MTSPPPTNTNPNPPPKRPTSATPFAVWGTTTGKPWLHHVCEIPTYRPVPRPPETVPKSDEQQHQPQPPSKPQDTSSVTTLVETPSTSTAFDPTAPPSTPPSPQAHAHPSTSTYATLPGDQSAMITHRESHHRTPFSAGDADMTGEYVRGVDLDDDSGDVGTGRKPSTSSISKGKEDSVSNSRS